MSEPGRIMALDIGDVRTGVAVTDPMQLIASPHAVVQEKSLAATLDALAKLVNALEPVLIVAGIPLNQHGERGPQAEKVMRFVEQLRQRISVEILTQDERYSTAEAQRSLIAANMRRDKRKQVVDKVAATHILQAYLERRAAQARQTEQ